MKFFDKAKKIVKSKFDLIRNENIKTSLLNALPFWAGAFISGGIAVLYAKLFSLAELGTHLIYDKTKWAFFIITPTCFVLAWLFVSKYAPYARGSGIPQVSAAIELSNPKHAYKVNVLLVFRSSRVSTTLHNQQRFHRSLAKANPVDRPL